MVWRFTTGGFIYLAANSYRDLYLSGKYDYRMHAEFNLFFEIRRFTAVFGRYYSGKTGEYYVAFGALSLNSSLADVTLQITTLVENALDIAEITQVYSQE